jgi:hypothetical protein
MSPLPKVYEEISPEVLALISERELLVQHVGYWPKFEDFEVLSITLERPVLSATAHDLRATFLVFDLNKAPGDPERRQGSAELLFEDIERITHRGFQLSEPHHGPLYCSV